METQKQLTVKEALEQGYESYFYNSDGWQGMKYLSDIEKGISVDWNRDDIYIVEKHATQCIAMSEGQVREMILEQLECEHEDVTGSDDSVNIIQDAFKDFDFKTIEDAINNVLEGVTSYRSTNI